MSTVLCKEINQICCVYLDDIIIYGKDEKEHNDRLKVVLQRLTEAGLKLSREKCVFNASSVSYLGHIVDKNGVHTDPDKIQKVKS